MIAPGVPMLAVDAPVARTDGAVSFAVIPIGGELSKISSPSDVPSPPILLRFNEAGVVAFTPVTTQYVSRGVTFSANGFVQTPQFGFPGVDNTNLGNFGSPTVACLGPRSIHFNPIVSAAGFNVVTNDLDQVLLTAKRGGASLGSATFDSSTLFATFAGLAATGGIDELVLEIIPDVGSGGENRCMLMDNLIFARAAANKAPVAKCADRTVSADHTCQGSASIDDGSFDPDGDPINCTQVPSGPFGQGTTAVTLTCTDSHGTSASCTATVTVVDQTAPTLTCPADQTVECNDGKGGAAVTFTATASDNCDTNPAVACAPPSGSTFLLGTTVDACRASDNSSNISNCTHNVTVVDTTPATVITTDPAPLWPPNHIYHRIDLSDCIVSIHDACQGTLDIASHAKATCCTSDEPNNGLGDGDTADDCVIVDNHSIDVRAERSGNGNGRVYTIHYTVTDDSNNITDHTCTVSVPHSQNGSPAIDDGPQTTCQ